MSYSEVLGLYPNRKRQPYYDVLVELRNSHGTAPHIWNSFFKKYLGKEYYGEILDSEWGIYKNTDIPKRHRAVLLMTYDRVFIAKENYKQAAEDLKKYFHEFHVPDEYVNHWPKIIEILESNPKYKAIGFYMTSVGENLFDGEWNEKKDRYDPLDWASVSEVYEELNKYCE